MKSKHLLLVAVFLLANCSLAFAQAPAPQPSTKVLRNGDEIDHLDFEVDLGNVPIVLRDSNRGVIDTAAVIAQQRLRDRIVERPGICRIERVELVVG